MQNWNELVLDYQEEEKSAKAYSSNYYFPYFRKKLALINLKHKKNLLNHPKVDLNFLNDLEFENLVFARMALIKEIVNPSIEHELKEVSKTIERIIKITTPKQND